MQIALYIYSYCLETLNNRLDQSKDQRYCTPALRDKLFLAVLVSTPIPSSEYGIADPFMPLTF